MISILLATYNGEKYIRQCINSILSQTFTDFELLIGFNGTTDSTREIVHSFKDDRIKTFDYLTEKGKAKTLNKLLFESKFDWIAIQDDDDIWEPNKLEIQIQHTEGNDVVGSYINYINENGEFGGGLTLSNNHDQIVYNCINGINHVANSSSIIRRKSLLNVGGWREELDKLPTSGFAPLEDFDLWLRMIRNGNRFKNVPEFLVRHRIHKASNFNTLKCDLTKIM